jgi:glutathionyl-hydroquinone reductase
MQAGFTGSQDSYEEAYRNYFAAQDRLESILITQDFVAEGVVTESDLRLFPTVT